MKIIFGILFLLSSQTMASEPKTVDSIDLPAYLGLWHEIARIPNDFQDNVTKKGFGSCYAVTAQYGLLKDERISVRNSCARRNGKSETSQEVAVAVARIPKGSNGAKLKVNFTGIGILQKLGIGDGDYWVLALGPINTKGQYAWSLVGEPKLKYSWVLAREKSLDVGTIEIIMAIAEANGYSRTQFRVTEQ